MTVQGLKIRLVNFCVNHIFAGTKERHFEMKRKLLNSIGFKIGKGTKIVGPIYSTGKLIVGENCWIGKNFIVNGNGCVTIGNNCDIAPDVLVQTGSHEIGDETRRAGTGYNLDVVIGNGCWIGCRATILPGVIVGNSSVIASCACVNNNVDENLLVGGVPAKEIRKL